MGHLVNQEVGARARPYDPEVVHEREGITGARRGGLQRDAVGARESEVFQLGFRLAAQLRYMNDPASVRRDHGGSLVGFFTVGGDTSYVGPDFIAGWYDRNLRIFRNLQRITSRPDERLLVVYGAGHLATLRHFVESSAEYRLVEAGEYLGR